MEVKMTIKEVRGESVMEWKTKVTDNVNNVNGGNGNYGNNGCSYKTFTTCNPKEFDGKGGVSEALLIEELYLSNEIEKLENEFWNHTMVGANHVAYTDRFHELAKLVPHLVTPESSHIKRAISTVVILTDKAVCCETMTKGNDKRKEMEESIPPRNDNVNTYPKCANCYTFHPENGPCTFSINNQFATVLFNYGVDYSFISTKFAPLLNVEPYTVNPGYVIEIVDGRSVEVDKLPKNKAVLVCHENVVEIQIKEGGILRVHEEYIWKVAKALMLRRSPVEGGDSEICGDGDGVVMVRSLSTSVSDGRDMEV
ncbi:hypothetical protein Tco_0686409 [Tanacetum coccineum]